MKSRDYISKMAEEISSYESGKLDQKGIIKLFQRLVNTGDAWHLQGYYGRMAEDLLEAGLIMLGTKGRKGYWGQYFPSRYEVKPGSVGSVEYVRRHKGK